MTSLNRNKEANSGNCGTQTTRLNLARPKMIYCAGTLYCTQCPNFLTKSRAGKKYHNARNNSNATARVVHQCKIYEKDFHRFYFMRKCKRKEHGAQRGSAAQNNDVTQQMGDIDDYSLKEELTTCKHFLLDSGIENGRHRVYNFAMDTLYPKNLLEKLDIVFDNLKCAVRLNVAFSFALSNVEERNCRYY